MKLNYFWTSYKLSSIVRSLDYVGEIFLVGVSKEAFIWSKES